MSEFTYKAPNADGFLNGLIATLNAKGFDKIANVLVGSKCKITFTDRWSTKDGGSLFGAFSTTLELEIPANKYQDAEKLPDEQKEIIKKLSCELLHPKTTGLEITNVTYTVLISDDNPLTPEPYRSKNVQYDPTTECARSLLYTLENALRYFVATKINENQAVAVIDSDFIKDWEHAKHKEALPPRKPLDSNIIFYSSFEQLRRIITQNNNWDKIFKTYFGRQTSVISRLNELDEIRDTLAHNRIISQFDYNSFKSLFDVIMGCIEG